MYSLRPAIVTAWQQSTEGGQLGRRTGGVGTERQEGKVLSKPTAANAREGRGGGGGHGTEREGHEGATGPIVCRGMDSRTNRHASPPITGTGSARTCREDALAAARAFKLVLEICGSGKGRQEWRGRHDGCLSASAGGGGGGLAAPRRERALHVLSFPALIRNPRATSQGYDGRCRARGAGAGLRQQALPYTCPLPSQEAPAQAQPHSTLPSRPIPTTLTVNAEPAGRVCACPLLHHHRRQRALLFLLCSKAG